MFGHTDVIAPEIFQRLQTFGIREFGIDPVPPVKITAYKCGACSNIRLTNGKIQHQIYINHNYILTDRTLFGWKKVTTLHELTHIQQPVIILLDRLELKPINPAQYSHIEEEADSEALKHTTCWSCAKEYAQCRPYGEIGIGPIVRLLALTGIDHLKKQLEMKQQDHQRLTSLGYLDYKRTMQIADEKRDTKTECPYHKELNRRRLLCGIISPLTALASYILAQRLGTTTRSIIAMSGGCMGIAIENALDKLFSEQIEAKVASGEIEP